MKRSLIFLLVAGPLFIFGQRLDRPPALKSFQFSAPGPGRSARRSGDTVFFQWSLTGPGKPVRVLSGLPVLPGLPVRIPSTAGFVVREMLPDWMPCLVPLRMPEQMPMSIRGNTDPLPNAERRR
jgi:hypothetical protein